MAAKVHTTLRLEYELMERIKKLKSESEAISTAINRILTVGCDTLERGTDGEHDVAQPAEDANTARLIGILEAENARLISEHAADREAIAEKDRQLAAALEKSQELTHQAHVLMGMAQQPEALPEREESEEQEPAEAEQEEPRKISFREWWRNYR